MSEEPTPQEVIPEEPAPPALVTVIVARPLCEDGRTYRPGAIFSTTEERATRLQELGLVRIVNPDPPPPASSPPWWQFWRTSTPTSGRG